MPPNTPEMKRSLAIAVVTLFIIVFQAPGQIAVGPRVGVNINSFRGNKAFDAIPGFNAGGYAHYQVMPWLAAKGELLFMQQGANLIDYVVMPGELSHHKANVVFNTLQIPIMAEFGLPSLVEEDLRPKITVGGFYGYNFYSRERYLNVAGVEGYDKIEYRGHSDVSSLFQKNTWGLVGALGADLKIFGQQLYLEFRYTHNLPAITKGSTVNRYNLKNTFDEWGKDNLYIGTVSFNVAVPLKYF